MIVAEYIDSLQDQYEKAKAAHEDAVARRERSARELEQAKMDVSASEQVVETLKDTLASLGQIQANPR